MYSANQYKKLNNVFIFALLIMLVLALGLFSFVSIPFDASPAFATFEDPSLDFPAPPAFTATSETPSATFYGLGLFPSVHPNITRDFNYRVDTISTQDEQGNYVNKNYGIYEAYFSNDYTSTTQNDAVDNIVRSFIFQKYVYDSETQEHVLVTLGPTVTDYDVIYQDETSFDNPVRQYTTETVDEETIVVDYEPEDVKIASCIVEGIRWDGSYYSGSLRNIDAAGTYRIKTLSITFGGQTYSAPANMHLMILLKAKLTVSSSQFENLFAGNKQFGLSPEERTYGVKPNLRDLFGIYNTTATPGKFYFSAETDYFYINSFGKNSSGVVVDSQSLLTNLSNIKDSLAIDWYKYEEIAFEPTRALIEDETIKDSGDYSISLRSSVDFDYFAEYSHYYIMNGVEKFADMTKVVDVVYGTQNDYEEFYKEITIEKRKLKFFEDKSATGGINGGIVISRETEFTGNVSAAINLFSGNAISSKEMWLSLNGVEEDYNDATIHDVGYTFSQFINQNSIASFGGSHFDTAAVGENKKVFMGISLISPGSNDIQEVLDNYEAEIGYYDNGTYYPFGYEVGTNFFELETKYDLLTGTILIFDGNFSILPNKISLDFSKEASYIYGQKGTVNDFDFNVDPIVSTRGTIFTNNWEIYIVNGNAADSATRDPVENRIYIGIMTGIRNNEATSGIVYTDGSGNKYTMYNARLYHGDYYFYYTVYVLHASTSSSYENNINDQPDNRGFFTVKDRTGNDVVEINLSQLELLSISKLKLSIQVNEMINIKDYDGTDELLSFNAELTGGNIYTYDQSYVTCLLDAAYSQSKAGENIPIEPNFKMQFVPGAENSPTAAKALSSYELDATNIFGAEWKETGIINKLNLNVGIVDVPYTANVNGINYPLYKRNYAENTYVILQVAKKGDVLPDGTVAGENYYYYYYSRMNRGVIAESKIGLSTALGISSDKCVKMTINGFLSGEGFEWEHSGSLQDFNQDPIDIRNIFSWVDTSRSPSVAISSTTDSSANETDYYRIEYNNAEILDFMFDNYTVRINLDSPDYAYLNIGKLDLENNFLFVQSNSVYYNYTGQSQINSTVTYQGEGKAVFNFSGHLESQNIINTLNSEGKTFADLVEVRGFYRDCDDTCPHGSYNLNSPEIKNMVIAGTYSLQFNLPSSRNYKGGTLNTSLQIYGKSVKATITFAIRSYLENNPVYNTGFDEVLYVNNAEELALYSYWMSIDPTGTAYDIIAYPKLAQGKINYYLLSDNTNITEIELQNNYNATKVYIDFIALNLSDQVAFDNALEESSSAHGSTKIYYKSNDSYIVADEHISGINEYYMFNEYTMNNTIIYEGFLVKNEFGEDVQEGFTSSDTTHSVIFSIDQYNDKAHTSGLINGIRAIDAFKHNFDITPANDEFYILKKALTIDVGENTNQTSVYTGNEIVPMYNLVGGNANVGFLGINVHSYTYDGVTQTYEYIKDNVVQPIEQIPFGMRLEIDLLEVGVYTLRLYARPNSEFDMNYATSREPTIITFTIVPLEIVFIGEDITIPYNNTAYELGSFSDYFSGEDSNFGQVSIVDITKSGIEVTEIIDSGIYYVIINGTLLEKYRKNLYFDDGSGNYVYSKEYSYIVTITASNDYQIKLTNNIGGVDLTDQDGFSYTYSGAVYSPSYVFLNLEKETDILPATYTVLNSQGLSEPIKNADTYTLIFEINAVLHEAYNPNYASYEGEDAKVFTIIVNKAPLLVTIGFEEGFAAEKTYLDDNSVIADHMDFIYTGWVDGESCYDPQNIITNPPIIDWDFFNGDTVITIGTETTSGVYAIKPKSGPDTSTLLNYYFSYDGSAIEFEIKKADPYLLVYGIYDEENDEYLDYYVYTGNALEPNVKRKYGDAVIDDSEELIGSEGIKITFAGQFVGTDKHNITESDIAVYDGNCIDVGEYVFLIEVEASSNYNAFEPAYFYLKVVKANLDINVLGEYEGLSRGFATKVYDRTNNYPTFNVTYSGFVGRDAIISSYSNPFPIYSYNLREQTTQITDLGLTHPLYKIYLNAEDMDEDVTPFDAGTYYIKLFIDNSIYGISTNYKINAAYITENDQNLYPVLVIQKRVIDIKAEERIVKTYDGTTKLLQGAVTKSKYSFTAKEGDVLTGVVEGDEENINLLVNYVTSCYERKDVNDENDNPTAINIRIYGYDIDNTNYLLDVAQSYLDDEENRYLYLVGTILQAETIVIFRNDENIPVTGTTSVVYDSQTHGLKTEVNGVNGEVLQQDIGFTIIYKSPNYNNKQAPHEAGEYTVSVTIIDTNYVNIEVSVVLIIEKAPVTITFNGDRSPVYATGNMGLVAYAEGVGGYYLNLEVSYYDSKGTFIAEIKKADAGTYTAYVVHNATTNFKYMTGTEEFEIRRREITVKGEVAEKYSYTGKRVVPKFTMEFNNVIYYPNLRYDTVVVKQNGIVYEPLNYEGSMINDNAPINAGVYRVSSAPTYGNFVISNFETEFYEFEIEPIDLVIGIADVKVKENQALVFNYTLKGNISGETINDLIVKPTIEFYDNNGNKLSAEPTAAGHYKVSPANAFSYNYNITYTFGMLTINKAIVSYTSGTGKPNLTIEGNFSVDTNVVVKEIDNVEYTSYSTMFDVFKMNYPEYSGYQLSTIYHIQFTNGAVEVVDGGKLRVRLLLSEMLDNQIGTTNNALEIDAVQDIKMAKEKEYYIANFKADGTVDCIKAEKDGEYLVFETTSIEAFCVMTNEIDVIADNSWILYVAICVGILLIIGTILIIKKRA